MPDGRLLNRDDLDAAFPDNPVRVDHVSMHGGVLNSRALKQFGYSAETETPPGGVIVRKDGTNEPYGLIMETAFMPVFAATPAMSPEQEIEATQGRADALRRRPASPPPMRVPRTWRSSQTMKRATDAGANIIDVIAFPFITDLDRSSRVSGGQVGHATTTASRSAG